MITHKVESITYHPVNPHEVQSYTLCERLRKISTKSKVLVFLALTVVISSLLLVRGTSVVTGTHSSEKWPYVVEPSANDINFTDSISSSEESEQKEDELPQHRMQRLPQFIVAGVNKCGTRALLNYLRIHPDIVTTGNEMHFFDKNDSYSEGLESYREKMPYSYSNQLTGEKSPSYFRTPYVPERIYQMNNSIKILIVVREPIARTMSHYLQLTDGSTHPSSFRANVLTRTGTINSQQALVSNSDYELYVDNWLRLFNRSQLLFVDGDNLIANPHLVMKDVQTFLGVRQYIDDKSFQFDKEKGFFCYYDEPSHLKCLGKSKGRPHPPIDTDLRLQLGEYFRSRNEMFFEKINQRFAWKT